MCDPKHIYSELSPSELSTTHHLIRVGRILVLISLVDINGFLSALLWLTCAPKQIWSRRKWCLWFLYPIQFISTFLKCLRGLLEVGVKSGTSTYIFLAILCPDKKCSRWSYNGKVYGSLLQLSGMWLYKLLPRSLKVTYNTPKVISAHWILPSFAYYDIRPVMP